MAAGAGGGDVGDVAGTEPAWTAGARPWQGKVGLDGTHYNTGTEGMVEDDAMGAEMRDVTDGKVCGVGEEVGEYRRVGSGRGGAGKIKHEKRTKESWAGRSRSTEWPPLRVWRGVRGRGRVGGGNIDLAGGTAVKFLDIDRSEPVRQNTCYFEVNSAYSKARKVRTCVY